MENRKFTNEIYTGVGGRESTYDLQFPDNWNGKLILFSHGFMGFKDWGAWNLMMDFFVDRQFAFCKYNVSHNGCNTSDPVNFVDLNAFAINTYTKEIRDLEVMLNMLEERLTTLPEIYLVGHSRGGGIALLMSHDKRISRIVSLAGIASISDRFPKGELLEKWKNDGFRFTLNGRTEQEMPQSYIQFQDFTENRKRLNIEDYCRTSNKPTLVIHGSSDTSVSIDEGHRISDYLQTELQVIEGADHTFGVSHPWHKSEMPEPFQKVCELMLEFFEAPSDKSSPVVQSMIADLIKLAKSDGDLREAEFQFLLKLAEQLGVSVDEFRDLFEKYIAFHPPKLEWDRIVQFMRLVLLMNVDGTFTVKELDNLRNIGIRMGLQPEATNEVLRRMQDYDNNLVPPDVLLEIFRAHHN